MRNAFAASAILAILLAPSILGGLPAHAEGAGPVTPPAATTPAPAPHDSRCFFHRKLDEKTAADFKAKFYRIDLRIEHLKGHVDDKQQQLNKLPPDSRQAQKLTRDIELNQQEIERQQEKRRSIEAEQLWAEGKTMGSMMGCD